MLTHTHTHTQTLDSTQNTAIGTQWYLLKVNMHKTVTKITFMCQASILTNLPALIVMYDN